jgi:hypothetical protein
MVVTYNPLLELELVSIPEEFIPRVLVGFVQAML